MLHGSYDDSRKAWQSTSLIVSSSEYPDQEENLAMSGKLQLFTDIDVRDGTQPMVEAVLGAVIEGKLERLERFISPPTLNKGFTYIQIYNMIQIIILIHLSKNMCISIYKFG